MEKRKSKNESIVFIHDPLLQDRSEKGLFVTISTDLRANPDNFFSFARIEIHLTS